MIDKTRWNATKQHDDTARRSATLNVDDYSLRDTTVPGITPRLNITVLNDSAHNDFTSRYETAA